MLIDLSVSVFYESFDERVRIIFLAWEGGCSRTVVTVSAESAENISRRTAKLGKPLSGQSAFKCRVTDERSCEICGNDCPRRRCCVLLFLLDTGLGQSLWLSLKIRGKIGGNVTRESITPCTPVAVLAFRIIRRGRVSVPSNSFPN